MPQGGVYRFDPPPAQPGPYVPIPAQGDQPPRAMGTVVSSAEILRAWWPETGEPRLDWAQLQQMSRNQDATITLTYGDQPPRIGMQDGARRTIERAWWPELDEPRLAWGQLQQNSRNEIAPLTLTYGGAPPLLRRERELLRAVRELWEPPWTGPQTAPHGPIPAQGDLPPRWSTARVLEILRLWDAPWTPEQRATPTAAWNIPLVSGYLPPARTPWQLWDAWVPPWVGPPPLVSIAPLGLSYGQQPPRLSRELLRSIVGMWEPIPVPSQRSPLMLSYGQEPPRFSRAALVSVLGTWEPLTVPAQGSPRSGWIPSTVIYVPPLQVPWALWRAWADAERYPPRAAQVAPLTRVYGQPPPIAGVRREQLAAILDAYRPPLWDAQGWTKAGAILYPRIADRPPFIGTSRETLRLIIELWQEPWRFPQGTISIPQGGDPIIPAGLPLAGVPCTAHFDTSAVAPAQVALLTGAGAGDTTEVVCVCGSFEPTDVIESAVFLAKLTPSSSPTVRKTIIKLGPTIQGRIAQIGDQTEKWGLLFELTAEENNLLTTAHSYLIQVTVTRDGVIWPKVVQRGTIQSIQGATARMGLLALLATQASDYLGTQDDSYLTTE